MWHCLSALSRGLDSSRAVKEKAWDQTTNRHKGKVTAVDRKVRDCWYEYTPHWERVTAVRPDILST